MEMKGKFGNVVGKYEVEYYQMTGKIWKQRGKIEYNASYNKWQDVRASDRKPWNWARFLSKG